MKSGEEEVEGALSEQSFPLLGDGLGVDFVGEGFE